MHQIKVRNILFILLIKIFNCIIEFYLGTLDIILMFRLMNVSGSGALSCEEFLSVYDVTTLQWEPKYTGIPWYHTAWRPLQILCAGAHSAITWSYFETLVCK